MALVEMKTIVKNLANNKAVGLDHIPNEFYKSALLHILTMSFILFNFLNHRFLLTAIMNVLILPLLKGELKDPSDGSNYCPIAIATAALKILEMVILER